jgi:hypothetical protein
MKNLHWYQLTLHNTVVTICTTCLNINKTLHFSHTVHLCTIVIQASEDCVPSMKSTANIVLRNGEILQREVISCVSVKCAGI